MSQKVAINQKVAMNHPQPKCRVGKAQRAHHAPLISRWREINNI